MAAELDPARRLADYAIAFDFMTKLSGATTEAGVVENMFDLLTQICAPATIIHLSVRGGQVQDTVSRSSVALDVEAAKTSMSRVHAGHARTPSGKGFDLVIGHGPTRDVLRVEGVAFVEYLDHYLNLALHVAPVLSLALTNARSYQTLQEERARQQFLAEAGAVLSSSLDVKETIGNVAWLIIGKMADFCIVDLVEADGLPVRLKVAHSDPRKEHLRRVFEQLRLDAPNLGLAARVTKGSMLLREVTPEYLQSVAQSQEHLEALHELDPKSILVVPILLRGTLLGTLVLASSHPTRRYDHQDLHLAEELAARAAFALENARLYEMAQRANRARDDVLGIVAHDLRNPLGAITLAASRLHCSGAPPDCRKRAATIQRAAEWMNRLIDDLLDIARVEAGGLAVTRTRTSVAKVILDTIETQVGLARAASLELVEDVSDEIPDVWADRDRLLQIFENLIGNAIKFTQRGGRIVIGASPAGREVLFWVKDTGPGIAPENLPHVFDRFWQAKRTVRAGAGLGLPIVRGIVEAHGGRVWVESALGEGSTFYFTIPVATADSHAQFEASPQRPLPGGA